MLFFLMLFKKKCYFKKTSCMQLVSMSCLVVTVLFIHTMLSFKIFNDSFFALLNMCIVKFPNSFTEYL